MIYNGTLSKLSRNHETITKRRECKLSMTREKSLAILKEEQEEAISVILTLSEKAEQYNQLNTPVPSGITPIYLQENQRGRQRKPIGGSLKKPKAIIDHCEHTLDHCPHSGNGLRKSTRQDYALANSKRPQIIHIKKWWCYSDWK